MNWEIHKKCRKVRHFVLFRADHFLPLEGEAVWVIWFGLEFLDHNGKLSTYPSPRPTLTLISHLGQNVGLGEG